jgi:cytoskeletal protein CcmA (bactofilin family)
MRGFFRKKSLSPDDGNTMFKSKGLQDMASTDKVDSVIGASSLVKGDIHSRGTLRIDGTVEGNVRVDATVIIGEKGVVKANITANHVIIGGTVHGNVQGRERVEVLSTGRMYGDVTTAASKFVVAEGVIFEGRCSMSQTDASKQQRVAKPDRHVGDRHVEEKQEVGTVNKVGPI